MERKNPINNTESNRKPAWDYCSKSMKIEGSNLEDSAAKFLGNLIGGKWKQEASAGDWLEMIDRTE